tara:strand:+ start:245 stop:508 length:264 start_codon:yes stop_codon:yes gene_type:complete
MKNIVEHGKCQYMPATGPLGDLAHVFRRLGGMSRLDVVFSLVCAGTAAFWACAVSKTREISRARFSRRVRLIAYQPITIDKTLPPPM